MTVNANRKSGRGSDMDRETLPIGWVAERVREVFDSFGGGTPNRAVSEYWSGRIPWLSSSDIKTHRIASAAESISKSGLENSSAKMCGAGSVLVVVRSGILAHTLPVGVLECPAAINQDIKCFDSGNNDLNAWLALALRHSANNILALNREGTTVQSVKYDTLKEFVLPIPPLAEQKRIVAKVEEVATRLKVSCEHLSTASLILKRVRQAVLAAACSGGLTEDWREKNPDVESAKLLLRRLKETHEVAGVGHGGKAAAPTEDVHTLSEDDVPESWAISELMVLCEPGRPITYGILKPGPNLPNGVPYVRVADFPGDRLNLTGIRKTSREIAHEYRRSTLRRGDLLLSIRGTAGRVCRVPDALDGANITQDTVRISVHPELCTDYIEIYLRCQSVQKRLESALKGVAVRGVNVGDVRALQVALPPLAEQYEIVRRVEALLKLADAIEARVVVATKRAEKMTQAILAKAFRGELAPTEAELARREGRDYEPASVLLERIRAEREPKEIADATPKRRRRFGKRGSSLH